LARGLIALAGKNFAGHGALSVLDAGLEVCLNAGSIATGTRSHADNGSHLSRR